MSDLAQQEPIRAEEPHRSRKLNVILTLALVLVILVKLWLKDPWLKDAVDVAITALAVMVGLETLWYYRRYIPRFIVVVICYHKLGANGRNTKWPFR